MIKKFFRLVLANAVGLYLVPFVVEGFSVSDDYKIILIGALVLSLVNWFIKPIVKLVSFPINFITLGFFGLIINALMLYLATLLVDGISVDAGLLRLDYLNLGIQAVELHWIVTLITAAFGISLINWILKKLLL